MEWIAHIIGNYAKEYAKSWSGEKGKQIRDFLTDNLTEYLHDYNLHY